MSRRAAIVFLTAFAGLLVITATAKAAVLFLGDRVSDGHRRIIGHGQIRFDGFGPERWAQKWRREHRTVLRLRRRLAARGRTLQSAAVTPVDAIRLVFGPYADQAVRVASCESGWNTQATNGQYYGLFQMGTAERAVYGDGNSALEQAKAAYRYFVASGSDWSPWTCKP
jgi:hypothetical protein